MKRILIILSVILCISMIFVACDKKSYDGDDEEITGREDNVEENISKLVCEINKFETFDHLIKDGYDTVDFDAIIEELDKIAGSGEASFSLYQDGKKQGTVSGNIAMKGNSLYATATNVSDDTVGVYTAIDNANKLVIGTWNEDKKNNIEPLVAYAYDLDAIFDEYEIELDKYIKASVKDMPLDLSEIKLPTITEDDITYDGGKYYLNKDYICDAYIMAADAIIDAMKNNGEELPDNFEEEYEQLIDELEKLFDAIKFDIYYYVKLENITGYGITVEISMDELADVFDLDESDANAFKEMNIYFEATQSKSSFKLEFIDASGFANKLEFNSRYIYEGKDICGIDSEYSMTLKSTSSVEVEKDEGSVYPKAETTDSIIDLSQKIMLDASKIDKSNSTVLEIKTTVEIDEKTYVKDSTDDASQNKRDLTFDFMVKTTDPNNMDVKMNMKYVLAQTENGKTQKDATSIQLEGNIKIETENVKVPEPPASVKEKMDKAKKNPIDSLE